MFILNILLIVWITIEVTTQLSRLGLIKTWKVNSLAGDRTGICLHPLCILYEDAYILKHERIHAEQMTRYSWFLWILMYLVSGKMRVRFEAEADVRALGRKMYPDWVRANAYALTDRTYFPERLFGIPVRKITSWQNPGIDFAETVQQEMFTEYYG